MSKLTERPVAGTVSGRDAQPGQTLKDEGRWFTIAQFIDSEYASDGVRVADVTLPSGETGTRAILDEVTYPLRGHGRPATVIQIRDWDSRQDVHYQIRYVKRPEGGWMVVRADNSRPLGWVVKRYGTDDWSAHITADAFKGDGPSDKGNLLDKVDLVLFNGESQYTCRSIGLDSKRDQAAELIIRWLHDQHAPALGFGRHWRVACWEDR